MTERCIIVLKLRLKLIVTAAHFLLRNKQTQWGFLPPKTLMQHSEALARLHISGPQTGMCEAKWRIKAVDLQKGGNKIWQRF